MFTGLIEDLGVLQDIYKSTKSARLNIKTSLNLREVKLGDSIAVNGVCLTVVEILNDNFTVEVMKETFEKTNLKDMTAGQKLNLERALKVNGRLDGHLVTGHVDGTGLITGTKTFEIAEVLYIETKQTILKYLVPKGSVAIDGVSLTVLEVNDNFFSVSLIPHTRGKTTLGVKKVGQTVNIEVDILAKYVEKFMLNVKENNRINSGISYEKLVEHGFI